jgi:aspartate/methionine/tyrosine aminotransferase
MWSVLAKHAPGTVRTYGAFYFLAQLPKGVSEEEAVHVLATEYRLLCTPGSAFGAPRHLRLSYGSLPEEDTLAACERLEAGLIALTNKNKSSK